MPVSPAVASQKGHGVRGPRPQCWDVGLCRKLLEAAVAGEGGGWGAWRVPCSVLPSLPHLAIPWGTEGYPALPMVWSQRPGPSFCYFVSLFMCTCSVLGSELSTLTSYLVFTVLRGGAVPTPRPPQQAQRGEGTCSRSHSWEEWGGDWQLDLFPAAPTHQLVPTPCPCSSAFWVHSSPLVPFLPVAGPDLPVGVR